MADEGVLLRDVVELSKRDEGRLTVVRAKADLISNHVNLFVANSSGILRGRVIFNSGGRCQFLSVSTVQGYLDQVNYPRATVVHILIR